LGPQCCYLSRGLASNHAAYKGVIAKADSERRGGGRGARTVSGLVELCSFSELGGWVKIEVNLQRAARNMVSANGDFLWVQSELIEPVLFLVLSL